MRRIGCLSDRAGRYVRVAVTQSPDQSTKRGLTLVLIHLREMIMRFDARILLAGLFCGVALALGPTMAQDAAPVEPQPGNIQIIRNPRETVIVISGVEPLDKKGSLVALGDLTGQMKQTVENLRRSALRAGALDGIEAVAIVRGAKLR